MLFLSLESLQRSTCADCRRADFWGSIETVPLAEVEELAKVAGVSELPAIKKVDWLDALKVKE